MEIYLTFDDGIQDGTEEVLSMLKETGVRATFFLIGSELLHAYKKDPAKCLSLISDIYENHAIGNHTYSHTNDWYADYYLNNGVVIDNDGKRMSIIDDFLKGRDQINHYLKMIYGKAIDENYPLARHQEIPLARFPGRKNWCIPNAVYTQAPVNNSKYRIYCEPGTEKPTQLLFDSGYHIFGWNTEWKMSFDFRQDAIAQKLEIEKMRGIDYSNENEVHPCFDMSADGNLGKDRLIEGWRDVQDRIYGSPTGGKVVMLMHDRAFRKGFAQYNRSTQKTTCIDRSGNSEAVKLRSLIEALQELNADFKTLDFY